MTTSRALAFFLALNGALGCGGTKPLGLAEPRPEPAPDPVEEAMSALDPTPPVAEVPADVAAWQAIAEPLHVVTVRSRTTGDAYHSFLVSVPEIGPDSTYDLARAVEVDTDTAAFGSLGKPYAYVASAASPTVARWTLKSDGSIEPGPVLDFSSLGMQRADSAGSLSFYAADKAYFCNQFDPSSVVIWNPEAMTILGSIPLNLASDRRTRPQVVLSQRADRLFVIASWQETFAGDWTRFGDHVQVIAIDPLTDSVVSSADEPRCNSFSWASAASDGTTYFSPAAYYAPLRALRGAPSGVESCALRIAPGSDRFEAGYGVDLASLTGGRPAGDLFLVADDTAFLRVWHSELVSPLDSVNSNWEEVLQEPGFLWWTWSVGEAEARRLPDQEPSGDAQMFVVDGKTYTPRSAGDASVLEQLDPVAGELRPGLRGPGQLVGVFRAR